MSKYADDIIDAYKRGVEDGRNGGSQAGNPFPYKDILCQQYEVGKSYPPYMDTPKR